MAGQTGTLSERMRDTAGQRRCQAKTGTLNGVSNLAGYCQSAEWRHARVRVLQRRDRNRRRRTRSRTTWRSASLATDRSGTPGRQQPLQPGLVEHRHPVARPSRAWSRGLAGDQVVGLLGDRAGHAPAGRLDALGGLLAGQSVGSVPVSTNVLPESAPLPRARTRFGEAQTDLAQLADQCRACARRAVAPRSTATIFSPMPGRLCDLLGVAASRASMSRKRIARLRPVTSPTSSIPSANSTRANGRCFEASIAASRLRQRDLAEALQLQQPLRALSAGRNRRRVFTSPSCCSSATCFSPSPSMSIAPRETKCLSSCQRALGSRGWGTW